MLCSHSCSTAVLIPPWLFTAQTSANAAALRHTWACCRSVDIHVPGIPLQPWAGLGVQQSKEDVLWLLPAGHSCLQQPVHAAAIPRDRQQQGDFHHVYCHVVMP